MNPGVYLFCLTPASPPPEIAGTGIDGLHSLFVEVIGDVGAVLSAVDLDDFSGPAAKEKMEDLAWVAPRALRHETVIMTVLEKGLVLPVRFGTVFSSLAAAAESLQQHQEALKKYFQATTGNQEWTLKVYVNRPQVRGRMIADRMATEAEQLAGLSPGKRYFLEKKIKERAEKDVTAWLKEVERDILLIAREASVGFSECRLQSREVTGREDEMFFHGAFLVSEASVGNLQRLLSDWNTARQDAGLQVELSGPWPPYHFAPVL